MFGIGCQIASSTHGIAIAQCDPTADVDCIVPPSKLHIDSAVWHQ